jgi:hypothetical protein
MVTVGFAQRRHPTVPGEPQLAGVQDILAQLDDRLVLRILRLRGAERACDAVTWVEGPVQDYGTGKRPRQQRIRASVSRLMDREFTHAVGSKRWARKPLACPWCGAASVPVVPRPGEPPYSEARWMCTGKCQREFREEDL